MASLFREVPVAPALRVSVGEDAVTGVVKVIGNC